MAFVAGAAAAATRSVAAHVSSNETSFEKQKAVSSLFLLLSHSTHSGLWWLGFSFSHPQRRRSVCGLPLPVVRMRAIRIVSWVTCPYLDLINVTELLSSCKSLKDLLNDNLGRRPFNMNLILLAIMTLLIAGSLSLSPSLQSTRRNGTITFFPLRLLLLRRRRHNEDILSIMNKLQAGPLSLCIEPAAH